MLEAAVAAGVSAAGGDALLGGVLPTPAAPLLIGRYGFDLAVVLSASHNPYHDNGIKFFGADGFKLSDEAELAIERRWTRRRLRSRRRIGRVTTLRGTHEDYLRELETRFADLRLDGLDVLLDCANGATFESHPRSSGASARQLRSSRPRPTGATSTPAAAPPTSRLWASGPRRGATIWLLAFDGDGDRVLAVDRAGRGRRRRRADRPGRPAPARAATPARRRRGRDRDDQLRLSHRDARCRHRGGLHTRRRPLCARGACAARAGRSAGAVRAHHRDGLQPHGRRHRRRPADAGGAGGGDLSRARRDGEAAPAPGQRAGARQDALQGRRRRRRRPCGRGSARWPDAGACWCARAAPSRSCG